MNQPYDPANPQQQNPYTPPGQQAQPGSFGGPVPDQGGGQPQGGFPPPGANPAGGYPPPPGNPQPGSYPPAPTGYPPAPGYGAAPPPPPGPPYGGPPAESSDYPVQVTIPYPPRSSRLLAVLGIIYILKFVLLIPSFICLYVIGICAFIVWWIAQWAILFTGRYPQGMHRFISGYVRWSTRTLAWLFGLTDRYPPFRLSP